MTDISIIQAGHAGVQAGMQSAEQAAADVARLNGSDDVESTSSVTDLAEAAVDLIVAENQVKASAAVIRAGDEMLGTIIDTIA